MENQQCPICSETYDNSITEDGLRTFDHTNKVGDVVRTCEKMVPRERCPFCASLIMVESKNPLEEFCIEGQCEYYRAE